MRARVAYIHSFGTTTILVAAALLLLAVGGAIVAFNGWPGSASDAEVDSVRVAPAAPARAATPASARPAAARPAARPAPSDTARRPAPRRASTAGLVKTAPATVPGTVVPGLVMIQAQPITPVPRAQPVAQPSTDGGDGIPGGNGGIQDPVGSLPDAGGLLQPIAALPQPPVAAPGPDVAGPGTTVDAVTMVDGVLGTLPAVPGLP